MIPESKCQQSEPVWKRYFAGFNSDALLSKATPAVLYFEEQMLLNMQAYENALAGIKKELRYAIKACALSPVLECIARSDWGADCQSLMEAKLALKAGIAPSKISLCSPRLSKQDLPWVIKTGLRLIADSKDQLEAIAQTLAQTTPGDSFCLGVRISLPVAGTVRFHSKLGMEPESIVDSLLTLPQLKPYIKELHHHGAARQTEPELLAEVAECISRLLLLIEEKTGIVFSHLNLGGGLEPESILNEHGTSTEAILKRIIASLGTSLLASGKTLVFEPGRAVVKDAACALTAVTNLKMLHNNHIAVVDISTNLLIPLPLAQFVVTAAKLSEPASAKPLINYDIVDGTCSPAGVICKQVKLPSLQEGQRLIVHHAGAYTFSLAEPFYDWLPDLFWIDPQGKIKQILDRQKAERIVNLIWGYESDCN